MQRGIQKRLCFLTLGAAVLACAWAGGAGRATAAGTPIDSSFMTGSWTGQYQVRGGSSGTLTGNFTAGSKGAFTGTLAVSGQTGSYTIIGKVAAKGKVTMTGIAARANKPLKLSGTFSAATQTITGTFSGPANGTFSMMGGSTTGGGGGGGNCVQISDGQGHDNIGAFENWVPVSLYGGQFVSMDPAGWITDNGIPTAANGGSFLSTVTRDTAGHTGSCAKLQVVQAVDLQGNKTLYGAHMIAGPDDPSNSRNGTLGVPVTKRFGHINFYFKHLPTGGDIGGVSVDMYIGGVGGTPIGTGGRTFNKTISSFTSYSEPILYLGQGIPDTAVISVELHGPLGQLENPHLGSVSWVDDICFGD